MAGCTSPIGGFIEAGPLVEEQFDFFTDLVTQYLANANTFSQKLADYTLDPVDIQPVRWDPAAEFVPFEEPAEPAEFSPPTPKFTGSMPHSPNIDHISTSGLNSLHAPTEEPPVAPIFYIPPPPTVTLPSAPGPAPAVGDVEIPLYVDDLVVQRPVFIPPDTLQDTYRPDLVDFQGFLWDTVNARVGDTGVYDVHARLQAMLAGGTGLPMNIEQALFDRAIMRDDRSSQQAVAQMESEWAAKGFSLPGATLLARTQEMRQVNRMERGRINRELSIQFHTQEIENLRFAVGQAVTLEGQLMSAHTQILSVARELADGHWVVAKGLHDSQLDIFRLYLDIYKTDVMVYTEQIKAELAKLEVYQAQLEGQRLIGTLNQQQVDIYKAELEGFLAGVEVYKAEVQGAELALRAEMTKVETYKARIDAYSAQLGAEKIKYEIYDTTVDAELVKAQVYTAQVDAYGKRIEAYRTEVGAEATKIEAQARVVESDVKIYSEQVSAWAEGIKADSTNLLAMVDVYKAELSKYTALLSKEQYRITGEARNFELELESEKARVEASLKTTDQAIAQLQHISNIGLSATEIASKVNAQLAASAMSAISVGASISSSNQVSASDDRSCNTNFSGTV